MCATVCPSQALFFGTTEQIELLRPRSVASNQFRFGAQTITTKVHMMLPKTNKAEYVDVTQAMGERALGKTISLNILDGIYNEEPQQ